MDFLVVPTVGFKLIDVWFAIGHSRRAISRINVTAHPAVAWLCSSYEIPFPATVPFNTRFSTMTQFYPNW